MAGYQTIEALRPILHRGPPAAPVVNRELVRPGETADALRPGEHRHWKSKSRFVKVGEHYVLSPAVIKEIRARRAAGGSFSMIAMAMKIAKSTVRRYASDVPTPLGRRMTCWESGARTLRKRNVAFAERLRRAGFSYREIGENLNCSEMTVRRMLKHLLRQTERQTHTRRMVPRVAKISGLSCKELRRGEFDTGKKTTEAQSKARHLLFWLLRTYYGYSYPAIAKTLGGFDHTSVLHGAKRAGAVANHLGVTTKLRPLTAARKLWEADWREVGK